MLSRTLILLAVLTLSYAKSIQPPRYNEALKRVAKEVQDRFHRISNPSHLDSDSEGDTVPPVGRNLLQLSSCLWMPAEKECIAGPDVAIDLLQGVGTPLRNAVINELTCYREQTEDSCGLLTYCGWSKADERCVIGDYQFFPGSPCVMAAPAYFTFIRDSFNCAKIPSPDLCNQAQTCVWSDDEGACEADLLQIFVGVSHLTFLKALKRAEKRDWKSRQEDFKKTFVRKNKKVDWDAVLKWSPKTKCPKQTPDEICSLVSDLVKGINSKFFYCSERYGGNWRRCRNDENCDVDIFGSCQISDAKNDEEISEYLLELPGYVDNPADAKILQVTYGCYVLKEEDECDAASDCFWTEETGCEVRAASVSKILAESGESKEDGFCALFDLLSQANCEGISSAKDCNAEKLCEYYENNKECGISDKKGFGEVFGDRKDLFNRYKAVYDKCNKKSSKKKCDKN